EWRGRTALYGLRHLMQLVAIKRLQTHGLSLAEIQSRLFALGDEALEQVAQLPPDFDVGEPETGHEPSGEKTERPSAFWTAAPAPVEVPDQPASGRQIQIPLAPGFSLLVAALREPDD